MRWANMRNLECLWLFSRYEGGRRLSSHSAWVVSLSAFQLPKSQSSFSIDVLGPDVNDGLGYCRLITVNTQSEQQRL
jgi:hypothetical protein